MRNGGLRTTSESITGQAELMFISCTVVFSLKYMIGY